MQWAGMRTGTRPKTLQARAATRSMAAAPRASHPRGVVTVRRLSRRSGEFRRSRASRRNRGRDTVLSRLPFEGRGARVVHGNEPAPVHPAQPRFLADGIALAVKT